MRNTKPTKYYENDWEGQVSLMLRDRRIALGFSGAQMAERLGMSRTAYWQWENGNAHPISWQRWNQWARAVGMRFNVELEDA